MSSNASTPTLIPPMDFAIAQAALVPWSYCEVSFYCGIFISPFLAITIISLLRACRDVTRSPRNALIHFSLTLVALLRVLHFLFGPFHTHTILAARRHISDAVVEGIYAYASALLLALYCGVAGVVAGACPGSLSRCVRGLGLLFCSLTLAIDVSF